MTSTKKNKSKLTFHFDDNVQTSSFLYSSLIESNRWNRFRLNFMVCSFVEIKFSFPFFSHQKSRLNLSGSIQFCFHFCDFNRNRFFSTFFTEKLSNQKNNIISSSHDESEMTQIYSSQISQEKQSNI